MSPMPTKRFLGAAMLAGFSAYQGAAYGADASPVDSPWEVLVPSGRIGRLALRVERAEFPGTVAQVATRLSQAWATDPWPVLVDDGAEGPGLSRLTPSGIETVRLRDAGAGRVEARRSFLDWRGQGSGPPPVSRATRSVPEPSFVAALRILGEPLASFASMDGDTGNLTRTWLAAGDVETVSRQVERVASRHELSRLLRFVAPANAPESLRAGRVLAFGGAGIVAVVTFNRHPAGTAVVVHCQERLP